MSRRSSKHHTEGYVLLAVGIAGAVFGYRDRLVFAVGAGVVVGFFIGYVIASRMKAQTYYSSMSPPPQPPRAEVEAPRAQRRELQQARRNGWVPPAPKGRMISLSPECMGREECLMCRDGRCQCPCDHDRAAIIAWNTDHAEPDPAEVLATPDDEEMPF